MFQIDYLGLRIVLFKIEDVAQVGGAPGIDRLVGVAHHADVFIFIGYLFDQLILCQIGVLKFIHHDVDVTFLIFLQDFGMLTEKQHGAHKQIVEIQGLAGRE